MQPIASTSADATEHRRFLRNAAASLGTSFLSLVIGLWFTPYLIGKLGVSVYGLIPLANSVTNYLSVLGVAVSGSVGRFVTLDLARGDVASANKTFNTFLFGGLALVAAMLPLAGGLVLLSPAIFNVPDGQQLQLQLLLAACLAAFLLTMLGNCFDSAIWATSRFDLRALIEGTTALSRVACIVLLFHWLSPRLWHVGGSLVLAAAVAFAGTVLAWRRLTPALHVRLSGFDRSKMPLLLDTSRWLFVNQTGSLLASNIDLVLINLLLGPTSGGHYAPLLQWAWLIRTASAQIGMVLAPAMVSFHAREESERLQRVAGQTVKLMSLIVAVPAGVLCGLGAPMLRTWLGPEFEATAPLVWLVLIPLSVEAGQMVLGFVVLAQNRVKWMALVTVATGLLNLGLSLLLTAVGHMGLYGIAIGGAVASLLRFGLLFPIYTAGLTGAPWHYYVRKLSLAPLASLSIGAVGLAAAALIHGRSWLQLMLAGSVISLPYIALVYSLGLGQEERSTVRKVLLPLINRWSS